MKKLLFMSLVCLFFSATAFSQTSAIEGAWTGQVTGQDGQPVKVKMVITDNAYSLDFGMDGVVEINGSYLLDGDQVTVWDTDEKGGCPPDKKGVYKYAVVNDTVTFTKVTDACPQRGNEPLVLKRM